MISSEVISLLAQARSGISPDIWNGILNQFALSNNILDKKLVQEVTRDLLNQDASWLLIQALGKVTGVKANEIAFAMKAIDCLIDQYSSSLEIIWTGPPMVVFLFGV